MELKELNMSSEEFFPTQDFVLVKPVELKAEDQTASGIIIIHEVSIVDRPQTGTIVNIGPDVKGFEIGNEILFPETDGQDFKFNNGNYTLYREKSILGRCKRK